MPTLAERMRASHVWGVLAVYLGASWVVLQIVDVVKQNLGLPDWVFPFALLLLLIGLPIILATALLQGRTRDAGASASPEEPLLTDSGRVLAPEEPGTSTGRRLFTWRNALIGGGLAFLFLAAVTGAFMYMRSAGIGPVGSLVAKGVLEERSRVVLAEFEAADSVLARTVTESFRVDLAQSPVLELVEPDSIENALSRMDLPEDTPLDEETARELALRDGIPALVAGEVAALGAGYVLTARLVSAGDGAVLASARASARDDAGLLDAIDEVSSKLREQVGESYTSLRETPSLAHVTTASLAALKKYTQAYDARHKGGNPEAAIQLLEEAVAIDSTFALAWRDLGTILGNVGILESRRVDATARAYRHRERLTERERYVVEASYYQEVTEEPQKVIETWEAVLRLDSTDAQALNNIGYTYYQQADWENALRWYERSHEEAPDVPMHLANVATTRANLGEFSVADSLYAELDSVSGNPDWDLWRAAFLWQKGDEAGARAVLDGVLREHPNRPGSTSRARGGLAALDLVHGRLERAIGTMEALAEGALGAGLGGMALQMLVNSAQWRLDVTGDSAGAVADIDAALERIDIEAVPTLDRPWIEIALVLAGSGEIERSREALDRWWEETPDLLKPAYQKYRAEGRGILARAEGQPLDALEELRSLPPWPCVPCRLWLEGQLFDGAGRADSAIVFYERSLTQPWNYRIWHDGRTLAPTHERLGQLYDLGGDLENAALHYARFVELWAEADPELQLRVEAARARLEAIVRERG
ncbi:MAG: tetratricopeptide repeat protein [marine benthic group bacterium]|nr:tetratricopeptide repeat protein [Gemmatimonadota bacterium]